MNQTESDAEYLARRRLQDARAFLVNSLTEERAPRLAPAMRALRELLIEERTVPLERALAVAARHSDVTVKTIDNMIRRLVDVGFVRRRGEYRRTYSRRRRGWIVTDTRALEYVEWPDAAPDLH